MLRRLVEQGKGRTSNKLRTYLRAAYQCAIDVRVSASIPVAFKAYGVQSNPVALTKRDRQFDSADKRPLTTDELRAYWRLIEQLPGLRGHCLRLHLLTGGQRIEQLVRLRWAYVRADSITIRRQGAPGPRPARAHGTDHQGGCPRPTGARAHRRPCPLHDQRRQADLRHDLVGLGCPRLSVTRSEASSSSVSGPAWKHCWLRTASAARSAGTSSRTGSRAPGAALRRARLHGGETGGAGGAGARAEPGANKIQGRKATRQGGIGKAACTALIRPSLNRGG